MARWSSLQRKPWGQFKSVEQHIEQCLIVAHGEWAKDDVKLQPAVYCLRRAASKAINGRRLGSGRISARTNRGSLITSARHVTTKMDTPLESSLRSMRSPI